MLHVKAMLLNYALRLNRSVQKVNEKLKAVKFYYNIDNYYTTKAVSLDNYLFFHG